MSVIRDIFQERGSIVYKVKDINQCLQELPKKYVNLNARQIYSYLIEYLRENNYIGVIPSIWFTNETTPGKLIEHWHNDINRLSKIGLNNKISISVNENNLRICTFNVHGWIKPFTNELNVKEFLNVIEYINADVLCLQEVVFNENINEDIFKEYPSEIENIDDLYFKIKELGYNYYLPCEATEPKNFPSKDLFFGNAIFSKCEFIKDRTKTKMEADVENRCFTKVHIKYKGDVISIINTHLDFYDKTGKTRKEQIKKILKYTNEDKIILTGDFNELWDKDYTEDEITWLKEHSISKHENILKLIENENFKEAFNNKRSKITPLKYSSWTGRRVDYVWYKGLSLSKSNVLYTSISDHLPLIVDF